MQLAEPPGPLGKGQKRKVGQQNKTITIGGSPILYTQPAVSAGNSISEHPQSQYVTVGWNNTAYLLTALHIILDNNSKGCLSVSLCVSCLLEYASCRCSFGPMRTSSPTRPSSPSPTAAPTIPASS